MKKLLPFGFLFGAILVSYTEITWWSLLLWFIFMAAFIFSTAIYGMFYIRRL